MAFLETKYLYQYLLLLTISFPLAASFESKLAFYKKFQSILKGIVVMVLIFIPWDIFFSQQNVWWFNEDYTLGFTILHLPIEEWLFFFIIPYACVFIYESLNYYFKKNPLNNLSPIIYLVLGITLIVVGLLNNNRLYTFITFSLSGIASLMIYHFKPFWKGRFLRMYLISWIPFLIINGALTGAFTKAAVVNYDPAEFMGVRIFTIPIEDSIYSFLMLLIVIAVYEWSRKTKAS